MSRTRNYDIIRSEDELVKLVDKLIADKRIISIDLESGYYGPDKIHASLHPEESFIVGVSFTNDITWARYIPLQHDLGPNFDGYIAARELWRLCRTGWTIAHNMLFEQRQLALNLFKRYLWDDPEFGEEVRAENGHFPFESDTLLDAYVAAEYKEKGLKYLMKTIFNYEQAEITSLFPGMTAAQEKCLRFNPLELTQDVINYVCDDVTCALEIYNYFHDRVKKDFIYKLEKNLIPANYESADFGIKFDWIMTRQAADKGAIFLDKLNQEIQEELSDMVGEPVSINLGSPQQLSNMLFNRLGLTTNIYTKGKKDAPKSERKMSTKDLALKKLAKDTPVIKRIREWKGLKKLIGSYLNKLEKEFGFAADGMVHANLNQTGTVTGRFSSSEPNYQNLPKTYRYLLRQGREIAAAHKKAHEEMWTEKFPYDSFDDRKCAKLHGCEEYKIPEDLEFYLNFRDVVMAPDDYYMFGYDLSIAEFRVIAGEAREPVLLKAFADKEDIHTTTAANMLGIPREQVTKEQRSVGKMLVYATSFQQSPSSLADNLGTSIPEADRLSNQFFDAIPSVKRWMAEMKIEGKNKGYAVTKFGRKMPIWEFDDNNPAAFSKGERACVNYPPQGCLPFDTRVLTKTGWQPIGTFVDGTEVWTGANWAKAVKLNKGPARRVRLTLSDGRTFDCDDRHKLLVTDTGPYPSWCDVNEIKGRQLARDEAMDWGQPDEHSVEDWYWVGRFSGDGSLCQLNNKYGYKVWKMSFDGVKEIADIDRFRLWLGEHYERFIGVRRGKFKGYSEGWSTSARNKGAYAMSGVTDKGVAWWEQFGFRTGKHNSDSVPPKVFGLDYERRAAFFAGREDADGHTRKDNGSRKITSINYSALQDMLRLGQTIGITGKIGKMQVKKGAATNGEDLHFYDLGLHKEIADLVVTDIEYLPIEEMYTLSVDDERHSFSSEGLISKNSIADYVKTSMVMHRNEIRKRGLQDKIRLAMNNHDALDYYVHTSIPPQQVYEILKINATPSVISLLKKFGLYKEGDAEWPDMVADWHIGKRWGSLTELEEGPNGKLVIKGDVTEENQPIESPDDDDGANFTDYDDLLKTSLDKTRKEDHKEVVVHSVTQNITPIVVQNTEDEQQKTVIIELSDMPDEKAYPKFLEFVRSRPGSNVVVLRAPEGELELSETSNLSPADQPRLSMLLGGAMVTYAPESINPADIVAGIEF